MSLLVLGVLSAVIQTIGYFTYGWKVLRRDIEPNPASWLMFAYGTTLLVIVEWDRDASLPLLILPAVCAVLSIGIAIYCLSKVRRAWWPEHPLERFSFGLDVTLTIAYIVAWVLLGQEIISAGHKEMAEVFILICWNIGVFTAFFPLLRQVYHLPHTEHATPWVLWTIAYSILAYITFVELGAFTVLMLYPLSHVAIHGMIAAHMLRAHWEKSSAITI